MADSPSPPPSSPIPPIGTGNGKMYAAMVAGALSTILVFLWGAFMPEHPLPAGMDGTLQTLLTGLAVWLTPHNLGQSS